MRVFVGFNLSQEGLIVLQLKALSAAITSARTSSQRVCSVCAGCRETVGLAAPMCAGQSLSTVEFERAGGRDGNKKWRHSVRTVLPSGDAGPPIAQWLGVCALQT